MKLAWMESREQPGTFRGMWVLLNNSVLACVQHDTVAPILVKVRHGLKPLVYCLLLCDRPR